MCGTMIDLWKSRPHWLGAFTKNEVLCFTGGSDWVKHNSHKASGQTLDQQLPVDLTQHRGGNGHTITLHLMILIICPETHLLVPLTGGVQWLRSKWSLGAAAHRQPGAAHGGIQGNCGIKSKTFHSLKRWTLLLLNFYVCPNQTALSSVIYDTLTSLMTSLISIEMEKTVLKCSFSRVRSQARPQGGSEHFVHHTTSWHTWWKASSNQLLMSSEKPMGEGFWRDSIFLFWAACLLIEWTRENLINLLQHLQ